MAKFLVNMRAEIEFDAERFEELCPGLDLVQQLGIGVFVQDFDGGVLVASVDGAFSVERYVEDECFVKEVI